MSDACLAPQGTKRNQPAIDFCIPPQGLKGGVAAPTFVPTDIAGLVAWYDADDASTITESGGLVSQWDDKSGQGNHVAQGTSTLQPLTVDAQQNGRAIVRTDGIDDYIYVNAFSGGAIGNGHTVLIALKPDARAGVHVFYDGRNSGATRSETYNNSGTYAYFSGVVNATTTNVATGFTQLTTVYHNVNGLLRENGVEIDTGSTGASQMNGLIVGSFQAVTNVWAAQDVGEILIYDSILAGTDLTDAENYLKARWDTP